MPTAKGLLWRAADAFTGGNLPELAAYIGDEGTYDQRVAVGRQILDRNVKEQGAAGSVANAVGTIAPYFIAGGAVLKAGRAVNAARAGLGALGAPALGSIARAAVPAAYQAIRAHPFIAAGALGAGWAAKNDYNNNVAPAGPAPIVAVTPKPVVPTKAAAAAQQPAQPSLMSFDEYLRRVEGVSPNELDKIDAIRSRPRGPLMKAADRASYALQEDAAQVVSDARASGNPASLAAALKEQSLLLRTLAANGNYMPISPEIE